ncbi:MAG: DUF1987 domain-containing protein [Salinivirgaceae bacterium]|nr:DUF1987 domain-containing protein [Salinivirgaceae bacterium]
MQETLKIDGNLNRPDVNFNSVSGELWISGRSIVENAIRFYEPLVDWIEVYCENPAQITELHLKLEYFNTSTSKYLLSIVELLHDLYSSGKEVVIYWYSSDEDMLELGEDYDAMIGIPFKFMEYSV